MRKNDCNNNKNNQLHLFSERQTDATFSWEIYFWMRTSHPLGDENHPVISCRAKFGLQLPTKAFWLDLRLSFHNFKIFKRETHRENTQRKLFWKNNMRKYFVLEGNQRGKSMIAIDVMRKINFIWFLRETPNDSLTFSQKIYFLNIFLKESFSVGW